MNTTSTSLLPVTPSIHNSGLDGTSGQHLWRRLCALAIGLLLVASVPSGHAQVSFEVPDFALVDSRGRLYQLRRAEARVVVLFFTANECPVARQSVRRLRKLQDDFVERGVRVWMVNSGTGDDRESIRKEAEEFEIDPLPILLDETQGLAALLDVHRTGTVVCIETDRWRVIYQGAIDDQLVEGAQKPAPTEHYLSEALEQFLDGQPVARSRTVARGCIITISRQPVSYARQVAPILEQNCFTCHSPGSIAPYKMTSYQRVHGMSDMIQEVILARRMPPWHADRHHGSFVNDISLTLDDARTLLRWIEQGASKDADDDRDPLLYAQPPAYEWKLGPPDAIVALPEPQEIPATGVLDYRHIKIPAPFAEDVWVKGVAVRPDNTRVVHHVIVRVREDGQEDDDPDDVFLVGWAPGTPEMFFPEDTGKLIPKGAVLELEMHYTTSGRPETDQSRIGIYLHREPPPMRLRTPAAVDFEFEIPPDSTATTQATYAFKNDTFLYDLSPHMHFRGAWFKFEALFPDGSREVLLSVPRYDFNWQHTYRLTEPKRMPAGTWILCTGGFDNTRSNPANPNPRVPVRWGDQSFDEMFIGFMNVAEIPPSTATDPAGSNDQ